MNTSEYKAVGYEHKIYCIKCLPVGVTTDDLDVAPVFADSEWDVYPVCAVCGCVHDYVVLLEAE